MGDRKSRIDRVMVNNKWQDGFPESEAVFAAPGISDHFPICVTILPIIVRRRPFKFFDFWMKHSSFANLQGTSYVEISAETEGFEALIEKFEYEVL